MKTRVFVVTAYFAVALYLLSALPAQAQVCDPNTAVSSRTDVGKLINDCRLVAAGVTTYGATTEPSVATATATKADNVSDFLNSSFGWGVGAAHTLGKSRVDSASVVNGIVRVDQTSTTRPIVALEAHHFFMLGKWNPADDTRVWAHGPFASVQASSDNSSVLSFGVGWMIGWSDEIQSTQVPTKSWNLGVGVLVEGGTQRLGDGIHANEPLPDGETQIRYKKSGSSSIFVLFSRAF
jgi:hypothetical protein